MSEDQANKIKAWFEIVALAMGLLSLPAGVLAGYVTVRVTTAMQIDHMMQRVVSLEGADKDMVGLIERKFDQMDVRLRAIEVGLAGLKQGKP